MPLAALREALRSPAYYEFNADAVQGTTALRVFFSTLPFLALHRPLGRAITLTMDSSRVLFSMQELLKQGDGKSLLKTIFAITALSSSFFMHPLGLGLIALGSFLSNLPEIFVQIEQGNLEAVVTILEQGLYLGTLTIDSVEIVAASLLLSMLREAYHSRGEFEKGRRIEGTSHMLMSLVRFAQGATYAAESAEKNDLAHKAELRSLAEKIEQIRNRAAISFYSTARSSVTPLWKCTEVWLKTVSTCNQSELLGSEKALSAFKSLAISGILFPPAIAGLAVGQALHFTAFLLSTRDYIHLKGDLLQAPEEEPLSAFQLNCCLTAGGFARLFGGLDLSDEERTIAIAKLIGENPNIILLQEVSDLKAALSLYQKLSSRYSDFYLHIGATPIILQNPSGLFVASRFPIEQAKFSSFSDIPGTETMVNKGFFSVETKKGCFINTHLSPSSDDQNPTPSEIQVRNVEQERILETVQALRSKGKSVYAAGDYNTKRGPLFHHVVTQSSDSKEAVCETDYLVDRNFRGIEDAKPRGVVIDYFLSFFSSQVSTRAAPTFNVEKPEEAISDHPALITEEASLS